MSSMIAVMILTYIKIYLFIETFEFKQIMELLSHSIQSWLALKCFYSSLLISKSRWDSIITWSLPLFLCFENGRSLILTTPTWNKISHALWFTRRSSKNGALLQQVPFFPTVRAVPGMTFLQERNSIFGKWKMLSLIHCTIRATTFLAPHGKGGKTYIASIISCYMTSSSGGLNSLIFLHS